MNILLLMPPTDLNKSYGKLKDFSNPQPSIGVAYIASVLRRGGHRVRIVDAYAGSMSLHEILDAVRDFNTDILGISVLTTSVEVSCEISKNARSAFPGIKIVMGNLHASMFADELLSSSRADYVVHREGEITMLELAEALQGKRRKDSVNGISYVENGNIVHTPSRPFIEDLDSLPFPAWDLLDMTKYSTDPRTAVKPGRIEMQMLATRGCPNQCTFCSSRTEKNQGSKYRARSAGSIADEMEYLYKTYGTEVLSFMDLAFPLVRSHAVEFCKEVIKRGINKKVKWFSECRVKPLDEELLVLMKKAGCVRVCFGIESGNDNMLKALKKNFTKEDVRRAVRMAKNARLDVDGMFMIGLPGETEDMIKETIDFSIDAGVRYAIFNIFVPYPGCELWNILTRENKIHFKSWSDFTSYPTYSGGKPVYVPDGLTHEKMMELQKYAMKKFYFRPRFIFEELMRMKPSKIVKYFNGFRALVSS